MGWTKYALIVQMSSLPDPMLVEWSRYSSFSIHDLELQYRDRIYVLPKIFNSVCKDILHKSSLASLKNRLKKYVLFMVATGCWRGLGKEGINKYLIHRLLDYKILVSLDWRTTRSAAKLFRLIKHKLNKIRNKRHIEELHLPIGLCDEINRSLNELKYVCKLYKLKV